MGCRRRLIDFFETQSIPYERHAHQPAYTAQAEASAQDLPGHWVAKVVVVMADDRPSMFVLPADRRLDFNAVNYMLRCEQTRLATESELARLFPDCPVGAMPPFGNWYGMHVHLDAELAREPNLTFRAGRHDESVTIPTWALERLSRADIVKVTHMRRSHKAAA